MLKPYPDARWPAFLRVLADTVIVFWTIVWAYLGWLIYQTVMGLQAIADAIKNTGLTFDQWIAAFRSSVPGGIPLLTQFLLDIADTLKRYSGDPLVSAGENIHEAIFRTAIILALLVAVPPILLVLLPYAGWRWRDMREIGPGRRPGRAPVRAARQRDVETRGARSGATCAAGPSGAAATSRAVRLSIVVSHVPKHQDTAPRRRNRHRR